jgi:AraC family transcriptional regulator, regulatory protein of adaptative response / methylated-DNA-[protein]-cysteine methyltransferase
MLYSDDQCWQIMQQRDSAYDGLFFIGVMTTKIYCRPSCSARPLRQNVRFFADAQSAQQAGLRACKRCHPDSISPEITTINAICRFLDSQENPPALRELASRFGYSPFHLTRMFKAHLGISPRQYSDAMRKKRLASALSQNHTVTHAALDAGYTTPNSLYYTNPLGVSPRHYRNGGNGLQIWYATTTTMLGLLLVAQTAKGICLVAFADDDRHATTIIHSEFPAASIMSDQAVVADALLCVNNLLNDQPNHHDIPSDIRATAFQQRVWDALRTIPRGTTLSYSAIAQQIGQPTASRAVAQACASNPLAIIVPCHRVVAQSGARGNYRWGSQRKATLLAYELPSDA